MQIVFSNADFVVINKPAGYLSVPSRFSHNEENLDPRPVVGLLLQEQLDMALFPVHRLDFEVEGLLIFAKNKKAHVFANSWFEKKMMQKTYVALTTALATAEIPSQGQDFEWQGNILRGKKRSFTSPHGQPSLTKAQFLQRQKNQLLLWHLQPVTGRPHQLRFDLSRHGFPILGDKLYACPPELIHRGPGIALRAFRLKFPVEAKAFQLPPEIEISSEFIFGILPPDESQS